MARPRNQAQRRKELVEAATDIAARKGLGSVRLGDVADAAGLTPGAVLYYYESLDELFFSAYERGIERFCREREEAVAEVADPARKLRTAISLGIPSGSDEPEIRLLYEFESVAFRSAACAAVMHGYVERQIVMYSGILEMGVRAGAFRLDSRPQVVARNIIALEDGLGIYVLTGHSTPDEVERQVLDYAASSTGVPLARLRRLKPAG